MAGIQLSTAGVTLLYAAEATAGTRPTTGYEKISEIKSIPELNPEPDNLETTLYITPTGAPQWAAKPTDLESMSLRSSTKKNVEV